MSTEIENLSKVIRPLERIANALEILVLLMKKSEMDGNSDTILLYESNQEGSSHQPKKRRKNGK